MLKKIVIVGSDSEEGKIIFDFFLNFKDLYKIVGLTSISKNNNLFKTQLENVKPYFIYFPNKDLSKELEININSYNNQIFYGDDNITLFIKQSDADIYFFCDQNIDSIKAILSTIHDLKDIVLTSFEPLLYSGNILPFESKLKGVNFIPLSLQAYSLNQFFKIRSIKELNKILLMKYDDKKTLEDIIELRNQKIDYNNFKKKFYNFSNVILVEQLFLLNYLYDTNVDQYEFYNQNKNIITVVAEFNDGTNLLNSTNNDIYPVLYYHFCKNKKGFDNKRSVIEGDKLNIAISKINLKDSPLLDLGVQFLKKGGSYPIVYFLALDLLLIKFYNKKINYKNLILKLEEILNNKIYYSKKPDLKTILALKRRLEKRL